MQRTLLAGLAVVVLVAGCGKGADAPADDAGAPRLRAQALAWLRADLRLWTSLVAIKDLSPDLLEAARHTLHHWVEDADLSGVRDADRLEPLPAGERVEWRKLWADVDALLEKAAPMK